MHGRYRVSRDEDGIEALVQGRFALDYAVRMIAGPDICHGLIFGLAGAPYNAHPYGYVP